MVLKSFGRSMAKKYKSEFQVKGLLFSVKIHVFVTTDFESVVKTLKFLILAESFEPMTWFQNH